MELIIPFGIIIIFVFILNTTLSQFKHLSQVYNLSSTDRKKWLFIIFAFPAIGYLVFLWYHKK